jgi:peptidyl-tRNA hydrolase
VVDVVLSRATAPEQVLIDAALKRGLEAVPLLLAGATQKAMQQLHTDDKGTA